MLAVVRQEFGQLATTMRTAAAGSGQDPRQRLLAACHAYLDLAQTHPRALPHHVRRPVDAEHRAKVRSPKTTWTGWAWMPYRSSSTPSTTASPRVETTSTDLFGDAVAL